MFLKTPMQKQQTLSLAILGLWILFPYLLNAQVVADKTPPQLQGVGIEEHLSKTIPLNLQFTNSSGETVRLADYFNKGKPVLLSLVYFDCPMLCTLVLNGLANGVQNLTWTPGKEFQMVTISIDPRDQPAIAAQKKSRYLQSLRKPDAPDSGWVFLVGEESQSKALANALGFKYYYDKKQKTYAHAAAIFILTETGKISRYLYGIKYNVKDLRLGLLEASEGKIGNSLDQLLLFCYHYDPKSQGYVLFATNLMKIGGIVTLVILALFLGGLWIKERLH